MVRLVGGREDAGGRRKGVADGLPKGRQAGVDERRGHVPGAMAVGP